MGSVAWAEPHPDIGTELIREWSPLAEPKVIVLLIHGMAEHCGRYEAVGDMLADNGFRVRGFDLIGAGGSGGERWDIDDWSRYHDQIESHVTWARSLGAPLVMFGFSMGGNLALGYAISQRPKPDLLVLSAPALGGGASWQRIGAKVLSRITPKLSLPNGFTGEQLSRDPEVGEKYFSDALVHTKSTVRLGAALFESMDDINANLENLKIPTLVLHGGSDPIVPPQSTAILADLPGVERRLIPGLRHEIFNEPEGPGLVGDVIAWIEAQI